MSHGDQSQNQSCQRSQALTGGGDSARDREKEKKGWFHSLTRRKKSDSALAVSASASTSGSQNNNNEVCVLEAADSSMASCSNGGTGTGTLRRRRDKDKRNVFARLRRKVGQGLSSLRNWHSMGDCDDGGTTDATYEFLTPAICPEPTLPFTHDYFRFIRKSGWNARTPTRPTRSCTSLLEMLSKRHVLRPSTIDDSCPLLF
ncbi:GD15367 [Drosophila simulans]|uniref:GD15367 n=1 Tax=Drosophila simulans TaxID=7240 RepID=B4NS80_DROSI|nr:GD15367 [Drosophila simulans]